MVRPCGRCSSSMAWDMVAAGDAAVTLARAWWTPEAPVYVPHHHPPVCALGGWPSPRARLPRRQPPRHEGVLALLVPSRIWGFNSLCQVQEVHRHVSLLHHGEHCRFQVSLLHHVDLLAFRLCFGVLDLMMILIRSCR